MTNKTFPCPCCGYLTLTQPSGEGSFEFCEVCWWEDDPVQFNDPNYEGGANAPSLNQAKINFRAFRASDPRFIHGVRHPNADEIPNH